MTRLGAHEGWVGLTMLGQGCSYIEAAGAHAAAMVLPGDLVTNCTASAVWLVQHVEHGGVAVLVAAGSPWETTGRPARSTECMSRTCSTHHSTLATPCSQTWRSRSGLPGPPVASQVVLDEHLARNPADLHKRGVGKVV